jgi:hypothetical protein
LVVADSFAIPADSSVSSIGGDERLATLLAI